MVDKPKLRRIGRNPRWYAETLVARVMQVLSRQSDLDEPGSFMFAQTQLTSGSLQPSPHVELAGAYSAAGEFNAAEESLVRLLDEAGSDKGSRHGYAEVYERWANGRGAPVRVVVEIGLGSPSALTPSNMGPEARPGASAVAFSRFFRDSWIIGADIDARAFPQGVNGAFFVANQLRPPSFGPMLKELAEARGFDFGVVDGLHVPEADINSLLFLLPWLRPAGLLSIEDIGSEPVMVEAWRKLVETLPHPYSGQIHECHLSHLVTITRQ